ncbi:DNA-processing protein DprA [Myroides odoratus]|uniref:DNA-processing protein DprA n=1 Tax=Myroides odoratus TaxID=256 RepID=UPI00333F7B3D
MRTFDIVVFLQLKGLGRSTAFRLVEYYRLNNLKFSESSAIEFLHFYNQCKKQKVARALKDYLLEDFDFAINKANNLFEQSFKQGIGITSYYDSNYPVKLRSLIKNGKVDSPIILYYKGDIEKLNHMFSVAIIGTRDILPDGIVSGKRVAKTFANYNFNVVSGLALGCDTVAHQGALEASNGITTAVLAHGLDRVYPKENKELVEQILNRGGVVLSEYPVGTSVRGPQLVERDRIQAGLSDATIVIQTGIKGGTMHAVSTTIENNKLLYAITYKSDQMNLHEKVMGNQFLIEQRGAKPLTSENIKSAIDTIVEYVKKQDIW